MIDHPAQLDSGIPVNDLFAVIVWSPKIANGNRSTELVGERAAVRCFEKVPIGVPELLFFCKLVSLPA
jgi:hypothetical protein